jgi:hypothetical protein
VTEKLKSTVNIPVWLMVMLVPLIVTVLMSIIVNVRGQAFINGQVSTMNERLNRIENKLDAHILND